MNPSQACRLCTGSDPRRRSHIIPKFVGRWLKQTGTTGKLRQLGDVNRRKQDLPVVELLCDGCEARFSDWERPFSDFFRAVQDGSTGLRLDEPWVTPLVLSVSWRVAVIDGPRFGVLRPQWKKAVSRACREWRQWLLDPTGEPRGHHYAMVLPKSVSNFPPEHRVNWYMHRGVDLGVFAFDRRPVVFWKVPGVAFLSTMSGNPLPALADCRLPLSDASDSGTYAPSMFELVLTRARGASRAFAEISDAQLSKIEKDYRANVDKFIQSPAFAVASADFDS